MNTADAIAAHAAALVAVDEARAAITAAQIAYEAALEAEQRASREMLAAIAADASDSLAVGTRVRHRSFPDALAIVVPSDGTGVSVDQNGTISHGFGPGEWIAL